MDILAEADQVLQDLEVWEHWQQLVNLCQKLGQRLWQAPGE